MNILLKREDDDPIAETRISLGQPRGSEDFYLVFRGDPEKVIILLDAALSVAKIALPKGKYEDNRRTML